MVIGLQFVLDVCQARAELTIQGSISLITPCHLTHNYVQTLKQIASSTCQEYRLFSVRRMSSKSEVALID